MEGEEENGGGIGSVLLLRGKWAGFISWACGWTGVAAGL